MSKNTSILIKCVILTSISIVFGQIKILRMPYGGSINLGYLPIMVASFMLGVFWGCYTGLIYSILKVILFFYVPPVVNPVNVVVVVILDYFIPYISLGLAGVFGCKKMIRMCGGIFLSMSIRFISTVISGILIWGSLIGNDCNIWIYSAIYNCSYILPETFLAIVFCPIIKRMVKYIRVS